MSKDFFEQFGGRADTIQTTDDDFFSQFGGRADGSQYIKPQPTVTKTTVVNKPVVKQPVVQQPTTQYNGRIQLPNSVKQWIENDTAKRQKKAKENLAKRAEWEQRHPIVSDIQKSVIPNYTAKANDWELAAKYGDKYAAPYEEQVENYYKNVRSNIAPVGNIATMRAGVPILANGAKASLAVASKAKPVAEFVAKHPFIAKTIAGAPAASVEGAGFGVLDKALSDLSGIETDYNYADAAKMGALINTSLHGVVHAGMAAAPHIANSKPVQTIAKAHNDLLNSDTKLGNTLANIEGTIANALNLGTKNETAKKYQALDEAIAKGSVPMNKQLTPEELELIKLEQNLDEEQAWQLKHMLDNGVYSPENVADDLSHVKSETGKLTPNVEEPPVKTQSDMSGEVPKKPLPDNFQTEEQFEQLPKQPKPEEPKDALKGNVVYDEAEKYRIPHREPVIDEDNPFKKRTKSPSTEEALANYEKNTGKKVVTVEPEEVPVKPQSIQPNKVESMPKVKPVKNKPAFPTIKDNKRRTGVIISQELKYKTLHSKKREHKLAEILNNPAMDKKVEKTVRRLMNLRPSSEVEQALNTIYRNAPEKHRDLIRRNNMRGYKLDDVPVNNKPLAESITKGDAQAGKLIPENTKTPVKSYAGILKTDINDSAVQSQAVTKLPAGKAEGSEWDNTLRVKPRAKRIGSDDLIDNTDIVNELDEGLTTKLDKDGKPVETKDKYKTDEQVETENVSKGVETQAANDLLPDDINSLKKEIAEYEANNKKLPRIRENKAIAEKIVNSELGVAGINNTVKSTKLTNILKTPKMDKKVQRCLQRLFALKQSREVEKVINKLYSHASDTHMKFIEELNNGKYTLDARKVFNSGKELKDEYVSPKVKRIDDMPSQQGFRGEDSARANMKRHGVKPKVKLANKSYNNLTELPKADKYDKWGNIKEVSFDDSDSGFSKVTNIFKNAKTTLDIVIASMKAKTVNQLVKTDPLYKLISDDLKGASSYKVAPMPKSMQSDSLRGKHIGSIKTIFLNEKLLGNNVNYTRSLRHEIEHAIQTNKYEQYLKIPDKHKTAKMVEHIKNFEECQRVNQAKQDYQNENEKVLSKIFRSIKGLKPKEAEQYINSLPQNEHDIYKQFEKLYNDYRNSQFEVEARMAGDELARKVEIYVRQGKVGLERNRSSNARRIRERRDGSGSVQVRSKKQSGLGRFGLDADDFGEIDSPSPEITPEVQQIYDYYKKLSPETEKLKIERGAITEEQAANRLKQQGDGAGKGLYYKDYSEPTGEAEFIEWTKDYNERRDSKVGEFGIKEKDGTKKANLKGTIKDAIQEKHTKFALDLVDKHFAKPIENGKIQAGYVGVNRALLGTAINRRYGTSWYETMLKGEGAIDKAFNEVQAKGWKEYAKRHNKLDYQIPKQVFDKLFDGSGETVAEYWSRYGKTHTHKAIAKTAAALLDAYNNSFKRGVLTSASFFLNNRMGNQIMLAAKSNPIEHVRSVFEAFKMKDSNVPIELVESSLLEAMNDFKSRKTYTGWNAFDNVLNLFGGHEINTDTLKKMVQPSKPVGVKHYVKMNGETVLEGSKLKDTLASNAAKVANKCIAMPNKAFEGLCDALMKFNELFERFERKQAFAIQVNRTKKQLMKTTGQKMITTGEAIKHLETHPEMMEVVIKNVEDALGDYNKFNNTEKKIFKRIVPFYSWYRTITRHTLSLAKENPTRFAMIALEMQRINERGEDRKEWQKGAFETSWIDDRTGRKILINKTGQIPYNTFKELFEENAKGSISPVITKGLEAARGRKFFNDSEITNKRYKSVSKYNPVKKKFEKDGYLDRKTGKNIEKLPLSTRAGYLGKEALQTAYPILRSPLVKAESLVQGVGKGIREGKWLEPDTMYDADFGGYYHNDHFYGKEKRYADSQMDEGWKMANRLGLSLQTKRPLSKKERAELNKKRKEKNKRFIDRFKNNS